ncbi:glycoside hydrolase family 2 protein [Lacticaseibacillus mingshuiensis]|uniref:Glycoside hydrolase family 2 protein n=1 Tax=Lacticaseibacillus mingshuiensis TaxID=2799574 RepID=A0ABW4CKZ7_9LACO|nr:sugar-binding domain-containing protein [Lacticaseibacillus mingshuiensis]
MARTEYPRPQFVRDGDWQSLNGTWQFSFDDDDRGRGAHWENGLPNNHTQINVPFVYQAPASGIDDQTVHDIVWYQRDLAITAPQAGQRALLHFGAVDYFADVFVNGQLVGHHEGGDSSFTFDITDALTADAQQVLTVRAEDRTYDETLPRGKQSWTGHAEAIWYTNSTGIWQPVWLEVVNAARLESVRLTPDLDHTSIGIAAELSDAAIGGSLKIAISFKGELVAEDTVRIVANHTVRSIDLVQQHIFRTSFHNDGWTWTPENPNLFDITFTVLAVDGQQTDTVASYFGLRKVSRENGMIFLNNRPCYQRLVLDQGYWPEGLLTAPTDEAFKKDIELAKAAGFNGCRKHQKVEDPRFLYWADKLGYLVWEEIASVPYFSENSVDRVIDAWQDTVRRDYNHPSIIMWVPFNESWGVDRIHYDTQVQHFSTAVYHLVHTLDDTRLVMTNDGWETTDGDVIGIHNYSHGDSAESAAYHHFKDTLSTTEKILDQSSANWANFANGYTYQGQPIVLSEFGGIGFDASRKDGWGYTRATSVDNYLSELTRVLDALQASECLWGYCYTQLTDVMQEVNGVLTKDREPKAPLEELHKRFVFPRFGRLNDTAADYRH